MIDELEGQLRAAVDERDPPEESLSASIQRLRDKLTSQAARVLDLFRQWDVDGDGQVSKKEFRKAMPDLGFTDSSPEVVDALFDKFDNDGEGEISFRELHKMLRRVEPKKKKVKVEAPIIPPADLEELRKQVKEEVAKYNQLLDDQDELNALLGH